MLLTSCKVHLELNWLENCISSNLGDSVKFKIVDAKLHVPIVPNLIKQWRDGFKRSIFWNSYQTIAAKVIEKGEKLYELPSS